MPVRWIYDYETIVNCFVAVFEDMDSDDRKVFLIHDLRNDLQKYLDFLDDNIEKGDWHYGFNCNAFDAQITEHILKKRKKQSEVHYHWSLEALWEGDIKTFSKCHPCGWQVSLSKAGEQILKWNPKKSMCENGFKHCLPGKEKLAFTQ